MDMKTDKKTSDEIIDEIVKTRDKINIEFSQELIDELVDFVNTEDVDIEEKYNITQEACVRKMWIYMDKCVDSKLRDHIEEPFDSVNDIEWAMRRYTELGDHGVKDPKGIIWHLIDERIARMDIEYRHDYRPLSELLDILNHAVETARGMYQTKMERYIRNYPYV